MKRSRTWFNYFKFKVWDFNLVSLLDFGSRDTFLRNNDIRVTFNSMCKVQFIKIITFSCEIVIRCVVNGRRITDNNRVKNIWLLYNVRSTFRYEILSFKLSLEPYSFIINFQKVVILDISDPKWSELKICLFFPF